MEQTVKVAGLVATTPRHIITSDGVEITSFRLAASRRRFDEATGVWVDSETNWYTVTCKGRLAINVNVSVNKGDRVFVAGLLKIRDWQTTDNAGTNVEIEAALIGHDLYFGTSEFTRTVVGATE
jgi:single-strand DNA-binding protein